VLLHNHQNRHRLRLRELETWTQCTLRHLSPEWPRALSSLEINFVSSAESGHLHREYLGDPRPTDIITFDTPPVGLLVICPEIAGQQRSIEGLSLHQELLTYIIHGCLHLCGLDDQSNDEFETMRQRQAEIRKKVLSL
jgi:probable rRNA maturation factor